MAKPQSRTGARNRNCHVARDLRGVWHAVEHGSTSTDLDHCGCPCAGSGPQQLAITHGTGLVLLSQHRDGTVQINLMLRRDIVASQLLGC